MATQLIKWLGADGSLYETQEEAERADLIQEVADVLDSAGYSDDYSVTAGAKALLEVYEVKKRIVIE